MRIKGNSLVTFQTPTVSRDNGGAETKSWANVSGLTNIKVVIDPITSAEQIKLEREGKMISHRIIMNYNSGVTDTQRVLWDGKYYKIVFVRNPNTINSHLEVEIYDFD